MGFEPHAPPNSRGRRYTCRRHGDRHMDWTTSRFSSTRMSATRTPSPASRSRQPGGRYRPGTMASRLVTGWLPRSSARVSLTWCRRLTSGRLKDLLGELAALPRAAVVVEDRVVGRVQAGPGAPSDRGRRAGRVPGPVAAVPVAFCETRPLAPEWTFQFLGAAWAAFQAEPAARARLEGLPEPSRSSAPTRSRACRCRDIRRARATAISRDPYGCGQR